MTTFYQPADVPERCFLREALWWLAFQRLPIAFYNDRNHEVRSATEDEGPEIESPDGPLTDEECRRAGIPPDPHFHYLMDESPKPIKTYDDLKTKYGHDEAMRRIKEAMDSDEEEYKRACMEWQPRYDEAIEYPASSIFVALRGGRLRASGRLLPSLDVDEAIASLKPEGRYVGDLPLTEIPSSFWTLKGIHFDVSAAQNSREHYRHVVLRTDDLLTAFPGERRQVTVEQIGDTLILNGNAPQTNWARGVRGRPSYPWERFHLEVSALLQRNELPAKKEAAIQHFQSWFERELDIRPSRAAIGEKLTPYYERFLRGRGQKNERMKRQYFAYLAEAKGHSEQTIDAVAKAIARFEACTRYKDFKSFHIEQARAFKRDFADQRGRRSGDPLSKATLYATLTGLKRFFVWLAGQPGYKSRIAYSDAEYFNLSAKETRIAKAIRPARVPTLDQIRHVIQTMPVTTEIERRDRALIAFTILTGARDGAIASFKMRHIDIAEGKIDQDAREVQTKFSKSFVTNFFPVGDDIRAVVVDWVDHLRTQKLWGLDDPLFPATKVAVGDNFRFEAAGLDCKNWSSASPIRGIFKEAFASAGLQYFNPHSFRKTLALLGGQICKTPEEYKAWSQNLGHDHVLTTFSSYGDVGSYRQAEIIRGLSERGVQLRQPT
jgi:integrase